MVEPSVLDVASADRVLRACPTPTRTSKKAAPRAWYERERDKRARGETKTPKPERAPIPTDLRGAPQIVSQIAASGKAYASLRAAVGARARHTAPVPLAG
jgi:hypothetical protein